MKRQPQPSTLVVPTALLVTILATSVCVSAPGLSVARTVESNAGSPLPAARPVPEPLPAFELLSVEGRESLAALRSRFGVEGAAAVLKLNRVDARHVRRGDTLIVPVAAVDLLNLSPFPAFVGDGQSIPKMLLVSRAAQAFAAYEAGKLVRWGPVSTGKKSTPTPTGLYFTNWKSRRTRSSVDPSWVLPWYFNIDNHLGVGIHEYDLPGYAASHGCVRMMEDDARWVFSWADQWVLSKQRTQLASGTPVIISGDFAYGKPPVWKQLSPKARDRVTGEEIDLLLRQHFSAIQARRLQRDSFVFALVAGEAARIL